jgi:hypothetical protein
MDPDERYFAVLKYILRLIRFPACLVPDLSKNEALPCREFEIRKAKISSDGIGPKIFAWAVSLPITVFMSNQYMLRATLIVIIIRKFRQMIIDGC